MKPKRSASEANSVPEKNAGPDCVHWCTATRIAGCAATLLGTYSYIPRFVGFDPKFVICTNDAAEALGAVTTSAARAAATEVTVAATAVSALVLSFIQFLLLRWVTFSCCDPPIAGSAPAGVRSPGANPDVYCG